MEPSVNVTRRISMPQILEDPDALTGLSDKDDGLIQVAANRADDPVVQQLVHRSTFPVATEKVPKEVRNLVAGGMAGMVAKTVVAPLERIKILFQISSVPFRLLQVPVVAKNIIKDEGALALWKGNTATMLRVFPYSGIQFMTFDRVKSYYLHLAKNDPERRHKFGGLTPVESLIAGMIAGTVSVICTYPLDLTRAQLAVRRKHKHEYNLGFRGVLKQTYSLYGFSGLYRGITPTVLGILPYSGFAFALNEQAKREIQLLTGRDLTTVERMQCGAFAGLFAQTIAYPLEVIRRRMQTIGLVGSDTALMSVGETKTGSLKPPSIGKIIRDLYQEQGLRGFFKGVTMNWMRGPIAFSISFTAYETVQILLESDSERKMRLPRALSSFSTEK